MRIGILGSGLMGGKLGTLFARAALRLSTDRVVNDDEPIARHWNGETNEKAQTWKKRL
jgi:hypothetical protein